MAALVASQRNPVLRAFYQRLLAGGKAKEVGARRLHAQVAHHPQLHGQGDHSLATNG